MYFQDPHFRNNVFRIARLHECDLAGHTLTNIKLYLYRFKGRYQIRLYGEKARKGKKPLPIRLKRLEQTKE